MSAPAVNRTQPENQAADVPISPAIATLTFDQPMVPETVQEAITITPSIGTQAPTYTWSGENRTLVIRFPQSFQPDTMYTVRVGPNAKAANNVTLAKPVEFTFTTSTALAVTGAAPAQPAQPPKPAEAAKPAEMPAALTFAKDIKPLAEARCDGCHAGMATGKMSVYQNALKYVTPNNPDKSPYYVRPIGNNHPNIWTDKAGVVRNWINAGAKQ